MKSTWILLLLMPALLFAVLIWAVSSRQIPIAVIGEIPAKDAEEIYMATKRQMRSYILPNLSWQSFKSLPRAIKLYSTVKLITIEQIGRYQYYVRLIYKTNGLPRLVPITNIWLTGTVADEATRLRDFTLHNCVDWDVRRETNGLQLYKTWVE